MDLSTGRQRLGTPVSYLVFLVLGLALAAVLITLFSVIALSVRSHQIDVFDRAVAHALHARASPALTAAMRFFTWIGAGLPVTVLTLLAGWLLWRRLGRLWEPGTLLICVGGAAVLDQVLKVGFHRGRPELWRLGAATGYSFPSGHAMVAVAFYGFIAYVAYVHAKESHTGRTIALLLLLMPLAIGASRIYLGVHWPSDVLGGLVAGAAWTVVCSAGLQAIRHRRGEDPA